MKYLRIILFAFGFAVFLAVITNLIGRVVDPEMLHSRLDQYFSHALPRVSDTHSAVTWVESAKPLAHPFGPRQAEPIGLSLTKAWQAQARAMETGETAFLPDFFSGAALTRAQSSAIYAARDETQMVVLQQTLKPIEFAAGGKVFQGHSDSITLRYGTHDGELSFYELTQDTNMTLMLREAAGWRIVNHERIAFKLLNPSEAAIGLFGLAGINYHPANMPWSKFWPNFDREVIAMDFARIKELGANSVRIYLSYNAFLDPKRGPENLENLRFLLAAAEQFGLYIVPTLFDQKTDFAPSTWSDDFLFLQLILPDLLDAPNIAFIDIKNEPDLEMINFGAAAIEAWLKTMIAGVRLYAPGLPVSIGWSNSTIATRLLSDVDIVSYHDYSDIDPFSVRLSTLRKEAEGKPVMVTETGETSYSAVMDFPSSPNLQSERIGERLEVLRKADGVFVSTLYDFSGVETTLDRGSPWANRLQASFGLLDADGIEKPAAAVVRAEFEALLGVER